MRSRFAIACNHEYRTWERQGGNVKCWTRTECNLQPSASVTTRRLRVQTATVRALVDNEQYAKLHLVLVINDGERRVGHGIMLELTYRIAEPTLRMFGEVSIDYAIDDLLLFNDHAKAGFRQALSQQCLQTVDSRS